MIKLVIIDEFPAYTQTIADTLLSSGRYAVSILSSKLSSETESADMLLLLDIVELEARLSGVDVVLYVPNPLMEKPKLEDLVMDFMPGLSNLLNTCIFCGVKHFVLLSQIASYGFSDRPLTISESSLGTEGTKTPPIEKLWHLAEEEVYRAAEEGLIIHVLAGGIPKPTPTAISPAFLEREWLYFTTANAIADAVLTVIRNRPEVKKLIVSEEAVHQEINSINHRSWQFWKSASKKSVNRIKLDKSLSDRILQSL
ncbi:MAG: hypothetical protein IPN29_09510 [Saprospiraceae bacterium]|nr:hypothetical protein [Saprospiraceae bacterium]